MRVWKALLSACFCFCIFPVQGTVSPLRYLGLMDDGDSIFEIAQANGFTSLVTAVTAAGFDDDLNCNVAFVCPKFTVFAPDEGAFAAVDETFLNNLLTDGDYIEHLRALLRYHVVRRKVLSQTIVDGGMIETALGETVNTTIDGDAVMINDAEVVLADIEAVNGVVHVIDKVLLPRFVTTTVVDIAIENPGFFEVLVDAIVAADLVDELSEAGAITVFAPTNTAFSLLGEALDELLEEENKETLQSILRYHVLPGIFVLEKLTDGEVETLQGETIDVNVRSHGARAILNENARITLFNILASNGVIHVIDRVLIPPSLRPAKPDIVQTAMSNDRFSTLLEAVVAADLVETLQGPGPFTVFAPTNRAFEKLDTPVEDLLSPENKQELVEILSYHVVPGKFKSSDLRDGPLSTTLEQDILVDVRYFLWWLWGATLNGNAFVTKFDIEASNGVIHAIDKVLMPPDPLPDIVAVASSKPFLSKLVEAVAAAELVETLQGDGPFTVLAPTNVAFEKLGVPFEDLLEDKEALADILLYHVVPGETRFSDLEEGPLATALEGADVNVKFRYFLWFFFAGVKVNQADIVGVDIIASNGVIHVIDEVLTPPTI